MNSGEEGKRKKGNSRDSKSKRRNKKKGSSLSKARIVLLPTINRRRKPVSSLTLILSTIKCRWISL